MECEKPTTPAAPATACGCLGYAYVPVQQLDTVYENVEDALCRGTIFPGLDLNICEYGPVCKEKGVCA